MTGRVRRRWAAASAALLSLVCVTACADAAGGADGGVAVRDSAGVQIVENFGYAWGEDEGRGWRVAPEPEVDIGILEGDPPYQLFRVYSATVLADSTIAVANSGTGEIRFFDRQGRFLRAFGREGEGPGEFRRLTQLWPYRGDSIIAWDGALSRATVIGRNDEVGRQVRPAAQPSNSHLLRPFADGSFIVVDERWDLSRSGAVQQQFMNLTLHDPKGGLVDSVGSFPTVQSTVSGAGAEMMVGTVGFSAFGGAAVADEELFIGTGSAPELEVRRPDGALARLVRWPDTDRSVTAADIDRYREQQLAGITDENSRRQRRSYLEKIPYAGEFPVYNPIHADLHGRVWAPLYEPPGATNPRRWLVLDADGRALGEVVMPEGLRVVEIGHDYVLGVMRDELHVEHVRLHRLQAEL